MNNISIMKRVFAHLEKKPKDRTPQDYQDFFDTLADDAVYTLECPKDHPVYGKGFHGKEAIINLISKGDPDLIGEIGPEMEEPLEYYGSGNRVVILGSEKFTIQRSGVTVRNKRFVIIVDFEDGRIKRMHQFEDLSEIADAYAG